MSESHGPYKGKGETVDVVDDRVNQSDTEPSEGDSDEPKYRDKQWLHQQYHVLKKPTSDIGDMCGVARTTICYWLDKHGIETRPPGRDANRLLSDREWLYNQYVELEKSIPEIAEERGVNITTVHNALEKQDIDRRSYSDALKIRNRMEYGDEKYNNPEWLRHQYVMLEKSISEIADGNGWARSTVHRALERHQIQTRSIKEGQLGRYKKKKSIKDTEKRELVSSSGIDASWNDLKDAGGEVYVPYRDSEWLREKYHGEGLNQEDIADICGVSIPTISDWMGRHGIDTRPPGTTKDSGGD